MKVHATIHYECVYKSYVYLHWITNTILRLDARHLIYLPINSPTLHLIIVKQWRVKNALLSKTAMTF